LIFRSASNGGDVVDGGAKFGIISGFSGPLPLAQHRHLEYKRDRLLPGAIRTTRLAITFILSIWIGLGIFLAQAIRNYSLLQFALPLFIWFPAIYLWTTHAWERGIFVLNWERQYVALCIISWNGSGQAAALIHRIRHSNEHLVGAADIGRVRMPVSAACAVLGPCYLSPPHACWR
jgi:hypothetical protein